MMQTDGSPDANASIWQLAQQAGVQLEARGDFTKVTGKCTSNNYQVLQELRKRLSKPGTIDWRVEGLEFYKTGETWRRF